MTPKTDESERTRSPGSREAEFRDLAKRRGFGFLPVDDSFSPTLPFLFVRRCPTECTNILTGISAGMEFHAFDMAWSVYGDGGGDTAGALGSSGNLSCVVAQIPADCPDLEIRFEQSWDKVRFENATLFSGRFAVMCQDTKFAHALVDKDMQEWLLGPDRTGIRMPDVGARLAFKVAGSWIMCLTERMPPSQIPELIDALTTFRDHIPDSVYERYPPESGIPLGVRRKALGATLAIAAMIAFGVLSWLAGRMGGSGSLRSEALSTPRAPSVSALPQVSALPEVRTLHRLSGNFDDGVGAFREFSEACCSGRYVDGGYLLRLEDPRDAAWAWALGYTAWRGGLRVEADLTYRAGPKETYAGVMALFTESTGYQFQIGRDKSYGVYKVLDSNSGPDYWRLAEGHLTLGLNKTNRLRLEVTGGGSVPTIVNVYVNEELVDSSRDYDGHDSFVGVGFFLESERAGAAALFDNLAVRDL